MRRIVVAAIVFLLLITMFPVRGLAMPASPWAMDEVTVFINNGLLPERLSHRDFRQPISRADFCTLIMFAYPRLALNPVFPRDGEATPFLDSFDEDVIWAYQLGIVSGTGGGMFSPDRIITRGEIAVMFHNLLNALNKAPYAAESSYVLGLFDDIHDIPFWAADSVALLVQRGVMQGTGANFMPRQTATFEQAILMINRLFNYIGHERVQAPDYSTNHVADVPADQPVNRPVEGAPGFIDHLDFTYTEIPHDHDMPEPPTAPPPGHYELQQMAVVLDGETEPFFVSSENVNRSLSFGWAPIAGAIDYEVTVLMRRMSVAPVPIPDPIPSLYRTGGALHFVLPEVRPVKNYSVTVVGISADGLRIGYHSVEFRSAPAPQAVSREQIFFNGEGTTPQEKQAAARTVTVNVWRLNERTGVRTSDTASFDIHHALADIMVAIFDEIYNGPERFPIRDIHTIRIGSTGEHGRGTAIDLNANENWFNCFRTGNVVGSFWRPFENPFSITPYGDVVTAFERHGFNWGGDSWRNAVDYMHFSFFGT